MDTAALKVEATTEPAPLERKPIISFPTLSQSTSISSMYIRIPGFLAKSSAAWVWTFSKNMGMFFWRLTAVFTSSGPTTKITTARTPATRAMDSTRHTGLLIFLIFFRGVWFSMARIGTLRTKAMAPPRRNGEIMDTQAPANIRTFSQ